MEGGEKVKAVFNKPHNPNRDKGISLMDGLKVALETYQREVEKTKTERKDNECNK